MVAVFMQPIRWRASTTIGANSRDELTKNWSYPPLFTSRSSASTASTMRSSSVRLCIPSRWAFWLIASSNARTSESVRYSPSSDSSCSTLWSEYPFSHLGPGRDFMWAATRSVTRRTESFMVGAVMERSCTRYFFGTWSFPSSDATSAVILSHRGSSSPMSKLTHSPRGPLVTSMNSTPASKKSFLSCSLMKNIVMWWKSPMERSVHLKPCPS